MKKLMFLMLALGLSSMTWAQSEVQDANDPEARSILEEIKKLYESYETIKANFSLIIEIPDQEQEVQQGSILQKGEQYQMDMDAQAVYCDGETIWVHLKDNKEVQVSDVEEDEEEGMMSPKDLLQIYEQEDFIYGLSFEGAENGKTIQQIEFKPTDRDSEYSKMRLTIEKKTKKVKRIKAFLKDGSRFTLAIDEFIPNAQISNASFKFDEAGNPDVHIEDTRF